MAKIFCVANQKGGVGKTTSAVNLAAGLAKVGQRVLLVDLDPQGNATMGSGVDKRQLELSVYDVLLESASIQEAAIFSEKCGYHVLGANRELAGAEVELVEVERREKRLRLAIEAVADQYDFVLIDCPPSLGLLTINALVAARSLLVPLQCEFFALEGLSQLLQTFERIRAKFNPSLTILGVVLTMYDRRNKFTEQIERDVRQYFQQQVYQTVIPRNVTPSSPQSLTISAAAMAGRSAPSGSPSCAPWCPAFTPPSARPPSPANPSSPPRPSTRPS